MRFDMSHTVQGCVNCGQELFIYDILDRPTHLGRDGTLSRGCRAASFEADVGWDDSIDRKHKARRPVR